MFETPPERGAPAFPRPARLLNADGEERRVGFELEFAGLDLDEACAAVQNVFGGRQEVENRFLRRVVDTRWGEFTVLIDARVLTHREYERYLHSVGVELGDRRARVEDLLARLASTVVPHEIVTPPVPVTRAGEVEALRGALRRRHARGTYASPLYAFGLHINVEPPDLEAETLVAFLRAFLVLADWLRDSGDTDLSRRLAPYINDFPQGYAETVVDPAYAPDVDALVADYVRHNPTRNRPLDLLPLFAHLRGREALTGIEEVELVKPRPAFHYRLPDCRIDEAEWTVAEEWGRWLTIERLAEDGPRLRRLARAYLRHRSRVLGEPWHAHVARWLAQGEG